MEYFTRYGLEFNPFLKNSKDILVNTAEYNEVSTLTANDFYRNLVRSLGAEPAFKKPDNFRIIQEESNRLTLEESMSL